MNSKISKRIQLVFPENEDKEEVLESIFKMLKENKVLTLSTVEGDKPYSSSAYYVFDDVFNLYIWTDKDSHHSKLIRKNSKVSVNIADSSQKWGSLLKGLQICANAKTVSGKELMRVGRLYIKRFPNVTKYVKKIKDFVSGELESVLFKLEINSVKVLDEERFGKDEFREILVKRS